MNRPRSLKALVSERLGIAIQSGKHDSVLFLSLAMFNDALLTTKQPLTQCNVNVTECVRLKMLEV
jgi:hypothetical protein